MKKQLNYVDIIKETVVLTWAVAIIAAAVYFFLVPSHTSVSSISGLGIVLSNFVPIPLSAITMVLNVVLLISWMCFPISWWSVWDLVFFLIEMHPPAGWILWQRS